MTWVKLDDGFFRNRKARLAGKDGRALFLAGLCHCAGALTDGHIHTRDLAVIAAEAEVKPGVATKLVEVGLWLEVADGWTVKDYRLYNRSATDVRRQRDEGRERAARSRERRAHGGRDGPRTSATGSADPSSSRPLTVSSSSSSTVAAATIDDDDDWSTIVAKRRLDRRQAEKGQVTSLKGWLKATVADVRDDHGDAVHAYRLKHPDATELEVADHVEPGPDTAKRRANLADSCPTCNGDGLLEMPDGTFAQCTHQVAS